MFPNNTNDVTRVKADVQEIYWRVCSRAAWCRRRDLNPGHGLERPAYWAGLYYGGAQYKDIDP